MPATEVVDLAQRRRYEDRRRTTQWAIRAARELRGKERPEMAELLGESTGERWTPVMVAKLETGRKTITVELLAVIAEALDLPLDFFVYGPRGPNAITTRYLPSAGHEGAGAALDLDDLLLNAREVEEHSGHAA